jgi:hypothetical protein
MNKPHMSDYDAWRNSSVGLWFFEHHLQGEADLSASENGRAVGLFSPAIDYMTFVRKAGVIEGIEHAINSDPFEVEREEQK